MGKRPIDKNVRNALAGIFGLVVTTAGINAFYDSAYNRGAEQATKEIADLLRDKEACEATDAHNCFVADARLKSTLGFVPALKQ